jgi:hypothetical protein
VAGEQRATGAEQSAEGLRHGGGWPSDELQSARVSEGDIGEGVGELGEAGTGFMGSGSGFIGRGRWESAGRGEGEPIAATNGTDRFFHQWRGSGGGKREGGRGVGAIRFRR